MTLRVGLFEGAPEEWDGFVRSAESWTPFHLWAWRRVIERVHRHECPYLAARGENGQLVGVLPLVRVKSLLFGHYLVSMPFVNYGGPLGEAEAVRALAQSAAEMARRDVVKLLELRSRCAQPVDLAVSHRKITVVLDLEPGNPDAVFARFPSKLRSQIRRPQKEGVTVTFGPDQVGSFFAVFSRHMRDLGTPTQPRAMFEALAEEFAEDVWFGCAYLDGRPIAGGCGFRWDAEFEMTWASALMEYNAVSANMGLYWAFVEKASRQGCTLFNLGRCTPGSSTHRFKQQWGGRDEQLHWYQWPGAGLMATPSPDNAAYSVGSRVWRTLPLGIATAVGPGLARRIP